MLIGTVLPSAAVSGYRGFANVEAGPGITDADDVFFCIGFSTTHGYQFSNHFFLGAGIGVQYSAGLPVDYRYNVPEYYSHLYHIPVYVRLRYDHSLISTCSVYAGANIGYDVLHTFYFAPEFGVRFGKNGPISYNLGVKINLGQERRIYYMARNNINRYALSISFGIEF